MANFPTSLPSATPADHGEVVGEIVALATELGLDPSGSFSTVLARLDALPRGNSGSAQVTAGQASTTTALADITGLTVTPTVGTSRRLLVQAFIPVQMATAANRAVFVLLEDGVGIQTAQLDMPANSFSVVTLLSHRTPSAGAHTYKVQFALAVAGSTLNTLASTGAPVLLIVQDIGPNP